jgi:hypothetical protein
MRYANNHMAFWQFGLAEIKAVNVGALLAQRQGTMIKSIWQICGVVEKEVHARLRFSRAVVALRLLA